jgi:hypothetical protein
MVRHHKERVRRFLCRPAVQTTVINSVADPDPDPLVRGTDPAPDPSFIKQKW